MNFMERQRLDQALVLNDRAGDAIVHGDYDLAVWLLTQAAEISPTARQTLLDRASEAAEMGVSAQALAAKVRRAKSS